MEILSIIFFNPFLNLLIFLYKILGSNMGLAIIALTLAFKLVTLPLNLRVLSSQRKIQQLKPKLDKLKQQHGTDRMALGQAQMELYKAENVSPTGACLPMLLQLPFLFGLYQAFRFIIDQHTLEQLNSVMYTSWLHIAGPATEQVSQVINLHFLGINLTQHPDLNNLSGVGLIYLALPILAAVTQLILSKMVLPPKSILPNPQTKTEVSLEDSIQAAQGQMVYLFPIITFVINLQFPSGLALYWTIGNIFSIIQQIYVNKRMPYLALDQQGNLVPAATLPQSTPQVIEAQVISEQPTKPAKAKKKHKKRK